MQLLKKLRGMVNIEKAYNACDRAMGMLKDYAKDPDAFTGEKKEELDEVFQDAEEAALRILALEGQKNWPGIYREMRKNLATMYIDLGRYDDAEEQCEKLNEYGPVGRLDSEEMLEKLNDRRTGKVEEDKAPATPS